MKKYRAGSLTGTDLIQEVEVVRETEKCVYIIGWRGKEVRAAKESNYDRFHDTWEAAHQFLIDKAQEEVNSLRKRLEYANGKLGQIKGIKKPVAA